MLSIQVYDVKIIFLIGVKFHFLDWSSIVERFQLLCWALYSSDIILKNLNKPPKIRTAITVLRVTMNSSTLWSTEQIEAIRLLAI